MFNDLVLGFSVALSYLMLFIGAFLVLYVFGMAMRQIVGRKAASTPAHGAVFAASEPEKPEAPESRDPGNRRQ